MFENLRNELIQDYENRKTNVIDFIKNGLVSDNNRGIERYSTPLRWSQYQAGEITREKAIEFATKRMASQAENALKKSLAQLATVAAAPDLTFVDTCVTYNHNRTWGNYTPHAETRTNTEFTTGSASGCGYDKESAAVAESFNKNDSILKVLYTLKEEGLKAGLNDRSGTACSGHDNRNICGYGAGYAVLPYFEGGVGVGCFWNIFKKAGFQVSEHYGKRENFYSIWDIKG